MITPPDVEPVDSTMVEINKEIQQAVQQEEQKKQRSDRRKSPKASSMLSDCLTIFIYTPRSLLLLLLLTTLFRFNIAASIWPNPMICQGHGGTLWNIPDSQQCHFNPADKEETFMKSTIRIFRYNEIEYKSIGYHCKKIRQKLSLFTYFLETSTCREKARKTFKSVNKSVKI